MFIKIPNSVLFIRHQLIKFVLIIISDCCLVFITLSVLLEIIQSGDSITLLRKILITTPLGGRESHAINQQRHHVRRAISEARNEFHITAQKMLSLRRALYYSNKSLREYVS